MNGPVKFKQGGGQGRGRPKSPRVEKIVLRRRGGRDVMRPGAEGTGGLFSCLLVEQEGQK
jgi:hypothetical protein